MVTMLDCIRRVPLLLEGILAKAGENYGRMFGALDLSEVDEFCLIGSGTSHTAALTARYFMEEASGIRVTVYLPNDFLHGHTFRNSKALYLFISQTGTSTITMQALRYVKEQGFLNVGVSEGPDTPIAREAEAFLDMGCQKEEYGMRTIGYSTTVFTLMWLGVEFGCRSGKIDCKQKAEYEKYARASIENIPIVIKSALDWMDKSRRRMMKSAFFSFNGVGSLSGVAMEAAVKMWEAPQYPSAGYELDEGMHGPNYGYNYNHAVFVFNDGGSGEQKSLALAKYMKEEHGNGYVLGRGAIDGNDLSFEPAGGPFSCLEFAAAVQVLMYRIAVDGGRDFSITGVHAKMNSYFNSHTDQ